MKKLRTEEMHGLFKIPDSALLKAAYLEIGMLNSEISEKNDHIDRLGAEMFRRNDKLRSQKEKIAELRRILKIRNEREFTDIRTEDVDYELMKKSNQITIK